MFSQQKCRRLPLRHLSLDALFVSVQYLHSHLLLFIQIVQVIQIIQKVVINLIFILIPAGGS